jgi:hypothetical protein
MASAPIPVAVESVRNLAISEGGDDTHYAVVRSTKVDLIVDKGLDTRPVTGPVHRPKAAPVTTTRWPMP